MKYYHVDVFSKRPYAGNGLTIFTDIPDLEKSHMQTITQEMRQFESIFLRETESNAFRAYIFTMEEELDFAGHPVIGAAALLHDLYSKEKEQDNWTIHLNAKSVVVQTTRSENYYTARMNQGKAEFRNVLSKNQEKEFLSYFSLTEDDKSGDLPFQVITTGLAYLILPVKSDSLSKVKVTIPDLEKKLEKINAKFFYILDTEGLQGRTWDNFGLVEDIATGSAAGPVGAFLVKNKLAEVDEKIILKQGDFVCRPSQINILVSKTGDIFVEGEVCKMATGELLQQPS
jgi:trans-2,3-dihydro-3-hydroxyanthranilate isomerase